MDNNKILNDINIMYKEISNAASSLNRENTQSVISSSAEKLDNICEMLQKIMENLK